MNGIAIQPFPQADLLHPARRLWKRILPNCSQATIETLVLGLDRSGDTPGSLAPDIWFAFLRNGEKITETNNGSEQINESNRALMGIYDHNVKDIFGLASLFRAFTEIAVFPPDAAARFRCDEENLAILWRRHIRLKSNVTYLPEQEKTAALLLEAAAKTYPRSCLRLGFDHFRQGRHEDGRSPLKRLSGSDERWRVPCTITVQALALRSLVIDAERRLGQKDTALSYIEQALTLFAEEGCSRLKEDLENRRKQLA